MGGAGTDPTNHPCQEPYFAHQHRRWMAMLQNPVSAFSVWTVVGAETPHEVPPDHYLLPLLWL